MKLETERLILRKLKPSDWPDIVEGAGDLSVAKWVTNMPHPYTEADAKFFIKMTIKDWGKSSYQFCIELKAEKKVIGMMGLSGISAANGTAMTGSWINKKYWKRGYITEAKIAINDFAFDNLKLRRLSSTVMLNNAASNATQLKMGYKHEGVIRKAMISKATKKIHDLNMYGLLKEDWKKARKRLIEK